MKDLVFLMSTQDGYRHVRASGMRFNTEFDRDREMSGNFYKVSQLTDIQRMNGISFSEIEYRGIK